MYFPRPYPDEPTASLLIRAARHIGYDLPSFIRHYLRVNPGQINFVRPFGLSTLSRLTRIPLNDLLYRHTFFPYVVAFMSPAVRDVLHHSIELEFSASLLTKFNYLAGDVRQRQFFVRYCDDCAAEDAKQYGEPYWHRQHLLPGIFSCRIHQHPLREAQVLLSSIRDALPAEMPSKTADQAIASLLTEEVSSASLECLQGRTWSVEAQVSKYSQLLQMLAGTHLSDPSENPVFAALKAFYGPEYLSRVNFDWVVVRRSVILDPRRSVPLISSRFPFNTTKHILLNILFDHLVSF